MEDRSGGHRRRRLLIGLVVLTLVINAAGTFAITKPWRPPPRPLPTVSPGQLINLLASPQELDTIMGTKGARVTVADVGNMVADPPTISAPDCLGSFAIATAPVYADSGYTGVTRQSLSAHDPDGNVTQAAVSFSSANDARAFLTNSATKWAGCANHTVDTDSGNGSDTWTFGPLQRSTSRLVQSITEVSAPNSECQRVLSAASNVIFDVMACRAEGGDEAVRITDALIGNLARVPTATPGAPGLIPPERILVALPQINSLIGTTDIALSSQQNSVNTDWTASEPDCLGSITPAAWPVYAGSGFTDIASQVLSSDDGSDDLSAYVVQSAATFATDGDASAFFEASANRWQSCADHTVLTGIDSDPDTGQHVGPLNRTDSSLEQVSTPIDRRQWACQHALRLVATAIVEAKVCGPAIGDPAARMTEIMAANAKG